MNPDHAMAMVEQKFLVFWLDALAKGLVDQNQRDLCKYSFASGVLAAIDVAHQSRMDARRGST